jgi:hypothetical protein
MATAISHPRKEAAFFGFPASNIGAVYWGLFSFTFQTSPFKLFIGAALFGILASNVGKGCRVIS